MQTVFNSNTTDELITRINAIQPNSQAAWGKMDIYQMLKHCTLSEEMFMGKKQYPRLFIGRLFGRMALKSILKDDTPSKRNQPTHPALKIKGSGDAQAEKEKWIALLKKYAGYPKKDFIHPFFGKMTPEQVGQFVYKHSDHHLRQFEV